MPKNPKITKPVKDAARDLRNPNSSKLVKELSAKILNDRKNGVKKVKH